jgi:hypothetical protein
MKKRIGYWKILEKVNEHKYKCECVHCGYVKILDKKELKSIFYETR